MPTEAIHTEVLIAGAGPVGLALAAELRRHGVTPLIVDRLAAGANTSRACVIHARTLEMLEPLGVTADLIANGLRVPTFRIRDHDRALMTINFDGIPSAYPFTLMCPQDRTEQILHQHFESLGGAVIRSCELRGYEIRKNGLEVLLNENGAFRTVHARWLVGCDGMHSRVREGAGIGFIGSEYEQSFVLGDVRMEWPLSREEVTLFFSSEGFMVVAPLPAEDRYRIVATADNAPETPSMEFIQSLLKRGPVRRPGQIRTMLWSSRFHIHHRVAQNMRKDRILLCGDAAHVHSPAGGQGMNTGIQDGVSLAKALAQTLGDGEESRLDTWAAERHRIASRVVALTDRMTRMATMKSTSARALRNAAVATVGHLPPVRARLVRNLAGLTN
ncbi:MAG TPA: FAD-dependent monooxygenase [Steroidobacteraceae bacterium]|jgi:2-polyprenyl-6-methoxyphenol hydroxylase-like FAD-dependent oxidoreductase